MGYTDIQKRLHQAIPRLPGHKNIRKISLFGSQSSDEAATGSDVDLLIEFVEPIGFLALSAMERSLSETLGTPVDLVTPNSLSQYFRNDVLRDAKPIYER